jgi:hypothetical protein
MLYTIYIETSVSPQRCLNCACVLVVLRSLSQIMSLEREVEEGREKERQLERERHDMERQINARSETFLHFTQYCGYNLIYSGSGSSLSHPDPRPDPAVSKLTSVGDPDP